MCGEKNVLQIEALPADPVAAAALALAEAIEEPWQYSAFDVWICVVCKARGVWRDGHPYIGDPASLKHAETCAWSAYRSAIAGRDRGR